MKINQNFNLNRTLLLIGIHGFLIAGLIVSIHVFLDNLLLIYSMAVAYFFVIHLMKMPYFFKSQEANNGDIKE